MSMFSLKFFFMLLLYKFSFFYTVTGAGFTTCSVFNSDEVIKSDLNKVSKVFSLLILHISDDSTVTDYL